ncbi:hypothetical protein BJ170DRAFT_596808 [Xylariales sp. AK1849]|nr:hypothetical protein BJ170DRAFT_596808 [Xylariales sp. AK1849]
MATPASTASVTPKRESRPGSFQLATPPATMGKARSEILGRAPPKARLAPPKALRLRNFTTAPRNPKRQTIIDRRYQRANLLNSASTYKKETCGSETNSQRLQQCYVNKKSEERACKDYVFSPMPPKEAYAVALNPFYRGQSLDGDYYKWLEMKYYGGHMPEIIRRVNKFRGFPQLDDEAFNTFNAYSWKQYYETEDAHAVLAPYIPYLDSYINEDSANNYEGQDLRLLDDKASQFVFHPGHPEYGNISLISFDVDFGKDVAAADRIYFDNGCAWSPGGTLVVPLRDPGTPWWPSSGMILPRGRDNNSFPSPGLLFSSPTERCETEVNKFATESISSMPLFLESAGILMYVDDAPCPATLPTNRPLKSSNSRIPPFFPRPGHKDAHGKERRTESVVVGQIRPTFAAAPKVADGVQKPYPTSSPGVNTRAIQGKGSVKGRKTTDSRKRKANSSDDATLGYLRYAPKKKRRGGKKRSSHPDADFAPGAESDDGDDLHRPQKRATKAVNATRGTRGIRAGRARRGGQSAQGRPHGQAQTQVEATPSTFERAVEDEPTGDSSVIVAEATDTGSADAVAAEETKNAYTGVPNAPDNTVAGYAGAAVDGTDAGYVGGLDTSGLPPAAVR